MNTTTPSKQRKPSVSLDKLIKTGSFSNGKGKPVKTELWEIYRKGADDKVTLRGYSVVYGNQNFYYGPAFYDKLGEENSCLNMALRKFANPTKAYPWPRI